MLTRCRKEVAGIFAVQVGAFVVQYADAITVMRLKRLQSTAVTCVRPRPAETFMKDRIALYTQNIINERWKLFLENTQRMIPEEK